MSYQNQWGCLSAIKEILSGKMGRTELQSFQGNRAGIQKGLVKADFAIVIPLIVLVQECISDGLWNKLND